MPWCAGKDLRTTLVPDRVFAEYKGDFDEQFILQIDINTSERVVTWRIETKA